MKKFLAIFTGTSASMEKWMTMNETERKAKEKLGMNGWKDWAFKNGSGIKDMGGPLSKTKRVDSHGIHDIRNSMAAYTIVEATNQEEAAKLFVDHPHFSIFPGDGVEIMEILPVPDMK